MEASARTVARALRRLHDVPFLQTHPMAKVVGGGKALQRRLLEAIDELGGRAPERGRLHRLLVLRYVEGLTPPAVQRALGLARSQYFAEHTRAVAAVVAVLAQRGIEARASGKLAAGPSQGTVPHNLRSEITSFVGRERELADLSALLASSRLITLTGAGGVGKTRLALRVAADALGTYPDGVWFVDLAPLVDPALVPHVALAALGLGYVPVSDPFDALLGLLRSRRALLLLDNCEHLLDACARLADTLLGACPGLAVLATSRERLGIAGEVAWRVPSLALPDPRLHTPTELDSFPAVRLFLDRARAVQPSFAFTAENTIAASEICRRLDGVPLAIELAAARIRVFSPEEIATRLDGTFRLLTGGSRTALPRQRTLRAAVDWSHDLLTEPESILFRRLAVFAGGWSLEAAESVCGSDPLEAASVLDLLTGLADKSLVLAEPRADGTRYRLLETIRQYGAEKLAGAGEADLLRNRHRDWYVAWAEEAERRLLSRDQRSWLARLDAEHDNLRAAIEWSAANGAGEAELRLAAALGHYWQLRGHISEAAARLSAALERGPTEPSVARARALDWLAQGGHKDRPLALRPLFEESAAIARAVGDGRTLLFAQKHLGLLLLAHDLTEEGTGLMNEALATARAIGEQREVGWVLTYLARFSVPGDLAAAEALAAEACRVLRPVGEAEALSMATEQAGRIAYLRGRYDEARALLEESLALAAEAGFAQAIVGARVSLGDLARADGDPAAAAHEYREALRIARDRHGLHEVAGCLRGIAWACGAAGRLERAARVFGAESSLSEQRWQFRPGERLEEDIAAVRAALGEAAFALAWAEGAAMDFDRAVDYALSESE